MEEHKKRFRGNFVRPEIFDMVEDGIISTQEAWLLLVIDNLVEHKGDDCWASNAYFGRILSKSEKTVERMITKLKGLGFIEQTDFDGRKRFLKIVWSDSSNTKTDPTKMRNQTRQKRGSRPDKNEEHNIRNREEYNTPRSTPRRQPDSSKLSRWERYASKLAAAYGKKLNKTKLRQWADHFRKLHEIDGVNIREIRHILDWYIPEIPKKEEFTPIAQCGESFRKKFNKLINCRERKMKEASHRMDKVKLKLSKHQNQMVEFAKKQFNGFGVSPPKELDLLVYEVSEWGVALYEELKEGEEYLYKKQELGSIKDIILPATQWSYLEWVLNVIRQKADWNGEVDGFFPSGKFFKQYVRGILSQHPDIPWSGKMKGIALA